MLLRCLSNSRSILSCAKLIFLPASDLVLKRNMLHLQWSKVIIRPPQNVFLVDLNRNNWRLYFKSHDALWLAYLGTGRQRASQQQVNKPISQGHKASALVLPCCIRNDDKDDSTIRYAFRCHRLIINNNIINNKAGLCLSSKESTTKTSSSCATCSRSRRGEAGAFTWLCIAAPRRKWVILAVSSD